MSIILSGPPVGCVLHRFQCQSVCPSHFLSLDPRDLNSVFRELAGHLSLSSAWFCL